MEVADETLSALVSMRSEVHCYFGQRFKADRCDLRSKLGCQSRLQSISFQSYINHSGNTIIPRSLLYGHNSTEFQPSESIQKNNNSEIYTKYKIVRVVQLHIMKASYNYTNRLRTLRHSHIALSRSSLIKASDSGQNSTRYSKRRQNLRATCKKRQQFECARIVQKSFDYQLYGYIPLDAATDFHS